MVTEEAASYELGLYMTEPAARDPTTPPPTGLPADTLVSTEVGSKAQRATDDKSDTNNGILHGANNDSYNFTKM